MSDVATFIDGLPEEHRAAVTALLDVFGLTSPWPWDRPKDDPFHIGWTYIRNRVNKGMTPEEIALDVEAKWEKDRAKRERQAAKEAATK